MTEQSGANDKSVAIVVECHLDAQVEQVWRALTEADLVAAWLMPNDMQLGARPDFVFESGPLEGGSIRCELLTSVPLEHLSYTWSTTGSDGRALDTVVTFDLEPAPEGGTHLRIEHGGFIVASHTVADRIVETEDIIVLLPVSAIARRRIKRPRPSALSRRAAPTLMRLAA